MYKLILNVSLIVSGTLNVYNMSLFSRIQRVIIYYIVIKHISISISVSLKVYVFTASI